MKIATAHTKLPYVKTRTPCPTQGCRRLSNTPGAPCFRHRHLVSVVDQEQQAWVGSMLHLLGEGSAVAVARTVAAPVGGLCVRAGCNYWAVAEGLCPVHRYSYPN